jgi:hypothetical protein
MKVKEMIEHLKKFDGNLQVYSVCDHGQTPEKSQRPSEIWIEQDWETLDDYVSVKDEADEYGYTVKAVIL